MDKVKLLVIGDTPTVSTGFGTVIENILLNLPLNDWDIHILGINYYGDPHVYQKRWSIYNPSSGGDVYGFNRLPNIISGIQPDLIFILNDPWVVSMYIDKLTVLAPKTPIVVYTPVDAPGTKPEHVQKLNKARQVVTYTYWAQQELMNAGLTTPSSVVPHGVNHGLFFPVDKAIARKQLYGDTELANKDPFVVLYVGRNQPRKRVDLFVYIMAQWIKQYNRNDVYFHYHGAPKGDLGHDVQYLTDYFAKELKVDLNQRLILTSKTLSATKQLSVEKMRIVYSGADLYFHVCAIEGWGLPLAEAMACGLPSLVPNYSALAEWPKGAVEYVDVDPMPWANPNNIDTIHKFVDVQKSVEALEGLYQNKARRDELSTLARKHITHKRFEWKTIGKQFNDIFKAALKKDNSWNLSVSNMPGM